jgi:hypothetical protein
MRVEQEQQIRDGILQARREVRVTLLSYVIVRSSFSSTLKAQRVISSGVLPQRTVQPSIDLSALNLNVPPLSAFPGPMNGGRDREAHLTRRVKELEEEVRSVRIENEKQVRCDMLSTFRT